MFKKIISVCICVILLVSIWLVPASAVEYRNVFPTTGSGFLKTYDANDNTVLANTSGVPNVRGTNPKCYYLFNHSASSSRDNLFVTFALNLNPEYTLKKAVTYTIEFDVVIPTVYLQDLYGFRCGLYSWKSVSHSSPFDNSNYTLNAGCFADLTISEGASADNYIVMTNSLPNHSGYTVKYQFTPSEDTKFACLYWCVALGLDHVQAYFGCSAPIISYAYSGEQYEEEEANTQGSADIDNALNAIPNDSDKFVNSLKSLANAVSYNGTDAKLTIPAMYIPAMSGMGNRINLTDEIEFNFSPYIQMIPSSIILVIQIILTLALIVYCFKELYDIIQMVMVNKGGGD